MYPGTNPRKFTRGYSHRVTILLKSCHPAKRRSVFLLPRFGYMVHWLGHQEYGWLKPGMGTNSAPGVLQLIRGFNTQDSENILTLLKKGAFDCMLGVSYNIAENKKTQRNTD